MEHDGTTRLYFHTTRPTTIREWWPNRSDDEIVGEPAENIYAKANYKCLYKQMNYPLSGGILFSYYEVTSLPDGNVFQVNVKDHPYKEWSRILAEAIEEHAGQKGLTIVVS